MKLLRSSSLFPVTVLLLLVGLTTWLQHATDVDTPRNDGKLRHDPDFIAENFTLRQLDAGGKLKYSLTATKMLHYADDESTDVSEPRLTYLASPPPLYLQARRANISKDGKIVDLHEDVRGRRESDGNDPEMTFTSSRLLVYPDDDVARTPEAVTLTQGRTVIKGVGMDADNLHRIYTLHKPVTGTIYPKDSKR